MNENQIKERLYEYRQENKKLKIALRDLFEFCEMPAMEQFNKIKYYINAKGLIK